jgi:hypothetical protein
VRVDEKAVAAMVDESRRAGVKAAAARSKPTVDAVLEASGLRAESRRAGGCAVSVA